MEKNNTTKLDWPFWKKFLLRVFLESRTPPEKKGRPETYIKFTLYFFIAVHVFLWTLYFIVRDPNAPPDDFTKPPLVVHGYIYESKSRGSPSVYYLLNDQRLRLYAISTPSIVWNKEILENKIDNPFVYTQKRLVMSGYVTQGSPIFTLTSIAYADDSTPAWNGIPLINSDQIIQRLIYNQYRPKTNDFLNLVLGSKEIFGILFILMFINSIFIFFDELKIAKLNR